MGILYSMFGIRPTNISEFYDAVQRKNIQDITISIGQEYVGDPTNFIYEVSRYIKFQAGNVLFKRNIGPKYNDIIRLVNGKENAQEDTVLMFRALAHKEEFEKAGKRCQIFLGDKSLDATTEKEWRSQAEKMGMELSLFATPL